MKTNKMMLSVFAVLAIGILTLGLTSAFPFGKMNQNLSDEDKAERQEFREAMQIAVESGDYEGWKSLMESRITEDEFNKMQERHTEMIQLRESGDFEGMRGQKIGQGMKDGSGKNKGLRGEGQFGECPFAE